VFAVSALAREGLQPLLEQAYAHVAAERSVAPDPDVRFTAADERPEAP
jgi:GTP-binding protein